MTIRIGIRFANVAPFDRPEGARALALAAESASPTRALGDLEHAFAALAEDFIYKLLSSAAVGPAAR